MMAGGIGLDPDAVAFLTAAGITDATITTAIDTLVIQLKAIGIWTKMKAIYPFVGGTPTTHKFNLINPADTNAAFRLAFSGGWTHSANGALPNGVNAFANTYLKPSTDLLLNSTHLSYYSRTNIIQPSVEMGVSAPSASALYLIFSYGLTAFKSMNRTQSIAGNIYTPTTGLLIGNRPSAVNEKYYHKGVLIDDLPVSSNSLSNNEIYLGCYNALAPSQFSSKQVAFASIGDGLTDTEAANYYTAVQSFQTTLARQVV
jgi:hypothetical protein